jgi:hypothetical protein
MSTVCCIIHNCTRLELPPLDVVQLPGPCRWGRMSSCCGRLRGFPETAPVITRGEDDLSPPPLYPTRVAEVGVVFRATSPQGSGSCPTISTLSGCGAHGVASVGASGLGQALVDLFLARRNRPDEGLHDSVVLVIVVVHPNIFHSQPCSAKLKCCYSHSQNE